MGISLFESSGNSILDNFVLKPSASGINLDSHSNGNLVIGNHVVNGGAGGIAVRGGSEGNQICENKISGTGRSGIFINNADGNVIVENKISNSGVIRGNGISLNNAEGTTVRKNKITDSQGSGILLTNYSTNNWIEGNKVTDCDIYGIAAVGPNLPTANTIVMNKVSGSGEYDLFDDTAPELQNVWEDNQYQTDNFE
jgi:parallel beta-helix repeat protein